MNSPKHLWSGDWENESAAAAAERARHDRLREPPPLEAPPPARQPRWWMRAIAAIRRVRLPRLPRPSRARRTAVLIALAALVLVAGAAYGLSSGHGSPAPATSAQTPWLGARLAGWPGGVVVAAIAPGGPAESAGLQPGDVITEVQGQPVVSPVSVTEAIDALAPGQTLALQFERGAASYTTSAKLAARPAGVSYP